MASLSVQAELREAADMRLEEDAGVPGMGGGVGAQGPTELCLF